MSTESIVEKVSSDKNWDQYFFRCVRYERLIYAVAVIGATAKLLLVGVNIYYLATGLHVHDPDIKDKGTIFSYIVIVTLAGSGLADIYLIRAVGQHFLRYIQWWMLVTLSLVIVSVILTVVTGFMFHEYERAYWMVGGYLCLMVHLPVLMRFVDKFAHANIFCDLQSPQI